MFHRIPTLFNITVLVFVLLASQARAQAPLPTNAVGWWPLDFCTGLSEGLNDMTQVMTPTTRPVIENGAILALPVPGWVACSFPFGSGLGGNSWIRVPDRPNLHLSASGFTMMTWAFLNDTSDAPLVMKAGGGFEWSISGGKHMLSLCSTSIGPCNLAVGSAFNVPTGSWHFLAVTVRDAGASTVIDFFVDSNQETHPLPLITMLEGSGELQIGHGMFSFLSGSLDEVIIFDRAFSRSEILNIYNWGAAGIAKTDCNNNRVHDDHDILLGLASDCNNNGVPDDCELVGNDCDNNGVPDNCQPDCDNNGIPDACELVGNDCDNNGVPDNCQPDCNNNGIPNACDNDCFLSIVAGQHEMTHDLELRNSNPISGSGVLIADWTFDTGGNCTQAGWATIDERVLNDGLHHWQIQGNFGGTGAIIGNSAVLGEHDLCWRIANGYGNDWYSAIRLDYTGNTQLTFDYLVDSQAGIDFMSVETDPNCNSFAQVDYDIDPSKVAADFRTLEFSDSGPFTASSANINLTNHGVGNHCVYIAFHSDDSVSQEDGLLSSSIDAAIVIDNIVLTGGTSYSENFTDGTLDAPGVFVNIQDVAPFGNWARLFPGISDNDVCTGNTTCSWLFSDNTSPTPATNPSNAFGPGGWVVKNFMDNSIVSPWVSLASTAGASRTRLEFEIFPGNSYWNSRTCLNVSVRGRKRIANTDTPVFGDSMFCLSAWSGGRAGASGGPYSWYSLGTFAWTTQSIDLTGLFDPISAEIQVRFRVADLQHVYSGCVLPAPVLNPGPGPFIDRVRIERSILTGPFIDPGIDNRRQAQDNFPTDPNNIFGTCKLDAANDSNAGCAGATVLPEDAISVLVTDVRPGASGIVDVSLYAAIVEGPHAGITTPPGSAAPATEFFRIPAMDIGGGRYVADIDDDYFRGGDKLVYFWFAQDAFGGVTTYPAGIVMSSPATQPATVALAQTQALNGPDLRGLFEVSFLPKINWDPSYVAAVQASANGKVTPTPNQILGSSQANEILYVQKANSDRRFEESTNFKTTLESKNSNFDVFDLQSYGNTNNDLASRASLKHVEGYKLIIHDSGVRRSGNIPSGLDQDSEKVDQQQFYIDYLNLGATKSPPGSALWLIGENLAEEESGTALLTMAGVSTAAPTIIGIGTENVKGVAPFTFYTSTASGNTVDFTVDSWVLSGRCAGQTPLDFDDLLPTGTGVGTHAYVALSNNFATVMNSNAAGRWSTIVTSFAWPSISLSLPPKPQGQTKVSNSEHPGPMLSAVGVDFVSRVVTAITQPDSAFVCSCTGSWGQQIGTSPGPRQLPSMAYDELRGVTILFGGFDGTNRLSDTWQWDGSIWTPLSPLNSPSARHGATMVYDSDRQVMVLYGGHDGINYLGDTWEWDGINWVNNTAGNSSLLLGVGLAYDANRQVTVRYGGQALSGRSRSTHEYDGTNWTLITGNSAPGFRSALSMAYDQGMQQVVMFGGVSPGGVFEGDTWTWDGTSWIEILPSPPSPRRSARLAYDSDCGSIYLFGGTTSGGPSNELWKFVAGTWTLLLPVATPTAVSQHGFAYDSSNNELVVFGGLSASVLDETWLYGCGVTSTDVDTAPPIPLATRLLQNYPNPFNPRTRIEFDLAQADHVKLAVFDVAGRHIRFLAEGDWMPPGRHSIVWDGRDQRGHSVASGVYYYRMTLRKQHYSRRMLLLR